MYLQRIDTLLPPPEAAPAEADRTLRKSLRTGMILIGVLVFGLGGLAATLPMASAVIASGEVSVESHVKRIGHPTGGVLADVLVRDGDHVRQGQLLMRLDSTVSRASAVMTGENVDQLEAREARLLAERDGLSAIPWSPSLLSRRSSPAVAAIMAAEERTFRLRREARVGQLAQFDQRVAQTETEIGGYASQAASFDEQRKLIDEELVAQRDLWKRRYTTLSRLNQLERSAVALTGSAAEARTSAAQARARISEIRQQALSVDQDARSQAGTELVQVQAQLSELRRNKVAAVDTDQRTAIRAPEAGVVDKLAFSTIGGVVPAGETLMELVPDRDRLVVTARVSVTDIDQVRAGQRANLRFSAFSAQTTPELAGVVERVSADRAVDERSGVPFYRARVEIPRAQLSRLDGLKLKPGMPVEVFIQTGERTMLSYLVKPLRDQLERSFREN